MLPSLHTVANNSATDLRYLSEMPELGDEDPPVLPVAPLLPLEPLLIPPLLPVAPVLPLRPPGEIELPLSRTMPSLSAVFSSNTPVAGRLFCF